MYWASKTHYNSLSKYCAFFSYSLLSLFEVFCKYIVCIKTVTNPYFHLFHKTLAFRLKNQTRWIIFFLHTWLNGLHLKSLTEFHFFLAKASWIEDLGVPNGPHLVKMTQPYPSLQSYQPQSLKCIGEIKEIISTSLLTSYSIFEK